MKLPGLIVGWDERHRVNKEWEKASSVPWLHFTGVHRTLLPNSGTFSFQGFLSWKALSAFNPRYWIFFYPKRNLKPHGAGIFVNQKVL